MWLKLRICHCHYVMLMRHIYLLKEMWVMEGISCVAIGIEWYNWLWRKLYIGCWRCYIFYCIYNIALFSDIYEILESCSGGNVTLKNMGSYACACFCLGDENIGGQTMEEFKVNYCKYMLRDE